MMMATGGLLRINKQQQNSLRAQKTHTHKRKSKRSCGQVEVRGGVRLCSLPGGVAALGVLVLMGGVVMATLGYWPPHGPLFRTESPDQGGGTEETEGEKQRTAVNETSKRSFLEDFLDRCLSSDRLKVFGPLVMGVGIFLFICANAVLHENRDKKTKVIDLRDIYSSAIDRHSSTPPGPPGPPPGPPACIQSQEGKPVFSIYTGLTEVM